MSDGSVPSTPGANLETLDQDTAPNRTGRRGAGCRRESPKVGFPDHLVCLENGAQVTMLKHRPKTGLTLMTAIITSVKRRQPNSCCGQACQHCATAALGFSAPTGLQGCH
jgi:hypothetical protein